MRILGQYALFILILTSVQGQSEKENVIIDRGNSVNYNLTDRTNLPKFIRKPISSSYVIKTFHPGQTLRLKCNVAEANAAPNITWYKENSILENDDQGRLIIGKWSMNVENATYYDSGNYTCLVCNIFGCISWLFKVQISDKKLPLEILNHKGELNDEEDNLTDDALEEDYGKPYFTKYADMHNIIAKVIGDNCTLLCPADGFPFPNISWYKNNVLIKSDSVSDDKSLTLHNVKVNDGGNYTCVVRNKYGTIDHTLQLQVYDSLKDMPIIIESPKNSTVRVGDTTYFVCKVSVKNESRIVWLKHHDIHPSKLNTTGSMDQFYVSNHLDDPQCLVLEEVNSTDHGWYTCLVTTPQGQAFSSAWLHVAKDLVSGSGGDSEKAKEPRFTKKALLIPVLAKPAGSTMRLKCNAEGNPTPNITWYKNGTTPDRNLGIVRYGQWSIILEDLVSSDSGNYSCVVCNIFKCIEWTYKVLILERFPHKPYIKDGFPKNETVLVNSTAVFMCPLLSDLEPYIQWLKFNSYIPDGETTPNGTVVQVP